MNKKILIFLGLLIFLNLGQVEARRRGGIISSGVSDSPQGTWAYRKPITVTNTIGTLTDYQIMVNIPFVSGKMNTDFSDIRFYDTDSVTSFSYWCETYTTSTARFWIKVPLIPASGTKTIYVYYGNASASSTQNISNTFIFGDDLNYANESEMLTAGWGKTGAPTLVFGNSKIDITANAGQQFIHRFLNTNVTLHIAEFRAKKISGGIINVIFKTNSAGGGISDADAYAWFADGANTMFRWGNNRYDTSGNIDTTDFHIYKFIHVGGISYVYEDEVQKGTLAWTPPGANYILFGGEIYLSGSGQYIYDWIRIRKYASTEPTYSIGNEEVL